MTRVNHEEKAHTYGSLDITNRSDSHITNNESSEMLPDNFYLIKRIHQMLSDDRSTIRIIREIKNDKFSTDFGKIQAIKELYRR